MDFFLNHIIYFFISCVIYLFIYLFSVEDIRFTRDLEDMTIKSLGVKVTLECEISKAGLRLNWFKGGQKLRRDETYNIEADGKVP